MSREFLTERQYHIDLAPGETGRYVLLPGDPKRVEVIARHLESPTLVADHREYVTYTGSLLGEKVSVTSTGIGGPSAAIAVEELAKLGADTFLRVGTCGGMQSRILPGDLVIPTGAIRMEGTTREYVPLEFPAVPSFDLLRDLEEASRDLSVGRHFGPVHCKDSFYGQHDPGNKPVGYLLEAKWDAFCRAGALASEMESAALFIVASTLGLRAATVLVCVNNQVRIAQGLSNEVTLDPEKAIEVAVEALKIRIAKDQKERF